MLTWVGGILVCYTKNGQSRDADNIGHTRHRTKTIQRHWQHWAHETQNEDKQINKTQQKSEN